MTVRALVRRLTSAAWSWAGLLVAVEALRLFRAAAARPLWYDELVTLHVSSLRPFQRQVEALLAGVDGMTPGFYLLVAPFSVLPIEPEVWLRLPSIVGYLCALIAAAAFASRSSGPLAGLAAVLLLAFSPFRTFAIEARPYAILVGLFALAAVFWQRVEQRPSGPLWLAAALAASTASHHLALGSLACLAAAEAGASCLERRWRRSVWLAMAIGATPAVYDLPLLLDFHATMGNTNWALARFSSGFLAYSPLLGLANALALLLVAVTVVRLAQGLAGGSPADRRDILLCLALILYPPALAGATALLGGAFTHRYGLQVVLGVAWGLTRLRPSARSRAGLVPMVACGFGMLAILGGRDLVVRPAVPPAAVSSGLPERLLSWSRSQGDATVVVASGIYFLPVHYYGAPELRARLRRVVDLGEAMRVNRVGSLEINDAALARYVSLPVEPLGRFLARQERFVVYSTNDVFSWLPRTLLERGFVLRLLGEDGQGAAYAVEPRPAPATSS